LMSKPCLFYPYHFPFCSFHVDIFLVLT
jgi:hypothetical protein